MNKQDFFNKYKNINLEEQELQRKYNLYLYEQQLAEMQVIAKSINNPSVGGGGNSSTPHVDENTLPLNLPFNL